MCVNRLRKDRDRTTRSESMVQAIADANANPIKEAAVRWAARL